MNTNNLTPSAAAQAYNSLSERRPILWQLQRTLVREIEIEEPQYGIPEDAWENDEVERGEE